MNVIWNTYCKSCKSFCVYGKNHGKKRFWCKLKGISLMPDTVACKKYNEKDRGIEELVDNDEYVQDLLFGRL